VSPRDCGTHLPLMLLARRCVWCFWGPRGLCLLDGQVDLENHSFRSFEGFLCLMQLSTRTHDFVIDTLAHHHSPAPPAPAGGYLPSPLTAFKV